MRYLIITLLFALFACGEGIVTEPPVPEEPYCTYDIKGICVHEYSYPDDIYCTYDVGGFCVWKRNRFVEIDLDLLVDSIIATEVYVNGFYSGLDFFQLAMDEGLRLQYQLAGGNQYLGTYGFSEANVWVRHGNNITRRMTCMDTYFTAMHELLHFIDDKFIMCEDKSYGGHNVPHLFMQWESRQSMAEERANMQSNTVEGLIYFYLSNKCGYEE